MSAGNQGEDRVSATTITDGRSFWMQWTRPRETRVNVFTKFQLFMFGDETEPTGCTSGTSAGEVQIGGETGTGYYDYSST